MQHPHPPTIPLLFSFMQVVLGNGFVAGVQVNGRALMEQEDDGEVWITAVAPVGFAGGGADRSVAFQEFRNVWTGSIFDIAAQAASFAEFQRACTAFLGSQQDSITALWKAAVNDMRNSHYEDRSLPRENADKAVSFDVVDLTNVHTAATNTVETGVLAAA